MGEFPIYSNGKTKSRSPGLSVHKLSLSDHDDKPTVLHYNLLYPLFSGQQKKPELDQEKSSMEEEGTLCKGSLIHTAHDDVSTDEVSSDPWDGNAADDLSNAPTGPVAHNKSKGQNLTAKGFVIMSQDVQGLTNGWKMFPAAWGDLKTIM